MFHVAHVACCTLLSYKGWACANAASVQTCECVQMLLQLIKCVQMWLPLTRLWPGVCINRLSPRLSVRFCIVQLPYCAIALLLCKLQLHYRAKCNCAIVWCTLNICILCRFHQSCPRLQLASNVTIWPIDHQMSFWRAEHLCKLVFGAFWWRGICFLKMVHNLRLKCKDKTIKCAAVQLSAG